MNRRSFFQALACSPVVPLAVIPAPAVTSLPRETGMAELASVPAAAAPELQARVYSTPVCECGMCMYFREHWEGATCLEHWIECCNPYCRHFMVRFKVPTVALVRYQHSSYPMGFRYEPGAVFPVDPERRWERANP